MWRSNATGIRSLSGLLLIVAAMLASPRKAGADVGTNSSSQCDGVLLPQLVIANSTRLQRLALISLITRENYEQVKRGIGVDLGIGPLSLGANYDEFDRNRSASSEFRDFKYSNAEARAIVRQSLSADQINAWVRCMSLANTVGIKLILSNDNKDGVNVELRYDGTVDTRFKFTVEADGGTIKNKTTRTYKLSAGGRTGFRVKRAAQNATIYLIVNGGQMTDEAASVMELPEPPPPPECTADDLLSANAPVTASANQGAAHLIVDGNGGLPAWNSMNLAPQSVEIDLGGPRTVRHIKLNPEQTPAGPTRHLISGTLTNGSSVNLGELNGNTITGGDFTVVVGRASGKNITKVKILTIASPSWIAWREIQVHGCRQ